MEYKVCTTCLETKRLEYFGLKKDGVDGKSPVCKACSRKRIAEYRRTKRGLVYQIHTHQKSTPSKWNHLPPKYSLDELRKWCFSQQLFHDLYDKWCESGFDRKSAPHIGRINISEGLFFDNFQLMSWEENNSRILSFYGKAKKAVVGVNIETGETISFVSIKRASIETGAAHTSIRNCVNERVLVDKGGYKYTTKSAGGYVWRYKNK